MQDSLPIGSVPHSENCYQVGSEIDPKIGRIEVSTFIHQLERMFPNGRFIVTANRHEFGVYYEAEAIIFDEDDCEDDDIKRKVTEAAYDAESNMPEKWDSIALEELEESLPSDYFEKTHKR